jgi:predicted Zn-dependent peptidase
MDLPRIDLTYRKTVLPHGVRVVTESIPHVRSASIGIWIDNGSRDESPSLNGISHFIEHMVFKGTRRRSVKEIAQSIESVGGYLNAFTGKEHTCYYARILDQHIGLALDVLSDMVLHATFPSGELEKEKGVVIEELKQAEDDPDDIIHDYFEKQVFGEHPLGFPVIGTERNLRRFTRRDLLAFRERRYRPERIVVAAAGNLTHEHIVELADRMLGASAFRGMNGDAATAGARVAAPATTEPRRTDHARPIQQAHVVLGTVGPSVRSRERFPLMVLNTLLGDGMSSRLFQNIRERYGFAYTVYSFANMLTDSGTVGAYVGTDEAHVSKCVDLVWKELDALKRSTVRAQELARTKAQITGNMMLGLESIPNRMMRLGGSELTFGEFLPVDAIIARIAAVTADDVRSLARDLFREDRYSTVTFVPNGKAAASLA